MQAVYSFTAIMLVWVISDYVSKKTKSLLSSLFVASLIFLIGFQTYPFFSRITQGTIFEIFGNTFSPDLLPSSSLLAMGGTIVGFVIVHLGTLISFAELKRQWKTFVIGMVSVIGTTVVLLLIGPVFHSLDTNYVASGIASLTGATVSIIIAQERALELGLASVAALPVLISAFQGFIGFPLSSILLKKEARRIKGEYNNGTLVISESEDLSEQRKFSPPPFMKTTSGTLFAVGIVVMISTLLANLTNGYVHAFVIALILGVLLREIGLFKPAVLSGIDAYGFMMLGILIIVFGPLASLSFADLVSLIVPIILIFVVGVSAKIGVSVLIGKIIGYSIPMSIAIGLTALYGFPGTMILSQEVAASVGENEEEVKVIENQIMPKMIIAGFSTVTITSVIITGIIVTFMG